MWVGSAKKTLLDPIAQFQLRFQRALHLVPVRLIPRHDALQLLGDQSTYCFIAPFVFVDDAIISKVRHSGYAHRCLYLECSGSG